MVNVVNRDDIIDTLQKNQRRIDMNTDQNDDLLLWDNKQVWLKYANPDSPKATTRFTRLYRTPTFNTPNDIEKAVARAGWLNVAGSTFKIRDKETAPQGFGIGGQSFDTITLGWDSNSDVGYLVRLTDKVNNRYDHTFTKTNTKYVLVVSSDINLD